MFQPRIAQLKNGLKVIRVPMRAMGSVSVLAVVNVGSRYESPKQQGIAHLIEHLVFKGTEKYPTHLDLSRQLDKIGADANAFTSKEYTGFYAATTTEHLAVSLDVISQLLFFPRLDSQDLVREKQVVAQEISLRYDDPSQYINNVFERLVYSNTGLAHDISGSKQTLNQIGVKEIKQFMEQWYQQTNLTLVVAGDEGLVSQDETLAKIEQAFSPDDLGAKAAASGPVEDKRAKIEPFLTDAPIVKEQLAYERRDTAQVHFALGWPGLRRDHPQRYALSVLATIIGGNRSSRLFVKIREKKGLAYYIWSDVDQYHDGGVIGAQGALDTDYAQEGLKETINQFRLIAAKEEPIAAAELEAAQDYVIGRMMLGLESSQSVARYYALKDILLNAVEDPEEVVQEVNAVTVEQLNQLAEELFVPDKLKLAVIGPVDDEQMLRSLLD